MNAKNQLYIHVSNCNSHSLTWAYLHKQIQGQIHKHIQICTAKLWATDSPAISRDQNLYINILTNTTKSLWRNTYIHICIITRTQSDIQTYTTGAYIYKHVVHSEITQKENKWWSTKHSIILYSFHCWWKLNSSQQNWV